MDQVQKGGGKYLNVSLWFYGKEKNLVFYGTDDSCIVLGFSKFFFYVSFYSEQMIHSQGECSLQFPLPGTMQRKHLPT